MKTIKPLFLLFRSVFYDEDSHMNKNAYGQIPMIAVLLATCVNLSNQTSIPNEPFHIINFQKPPGLYFEFISSINVVNSRWNLIAFVDLLKFSDAFDHLRNRKSDIRSACETRFDQIDHCFEWLKTIEYRFEKIEDELMAIRNDHLRSKRAVLDFVGNIAGDVFGVLDLRFRQKYQYNINGLIKNDEHLAKLLQNQKTMNILKNSENEIAKQNEQFRNFTLKIKKKQWTNMQLHPFSRMQLHI